jgi:hypothetical protein
MSLNLNNKQLQSGASDVVAACFCSCIAAAIYDPIAG